MMTVGSENLFLSAFSYQDGKEIEEMAVVLICSNETMALGDLSAVIIRINSVLRRCSL